MKHITLFSVLALALTLVSCGSSARISSEEKKANEQRLALAIQQKLNSKDYTIDVNYMIPIRAAARAASHPACPAPITTRSAIDRPSPYPFSSSP